LFARTIEAPGEVDQYTFTGEAGGIVTLTLVQTGGFPVGSSVTNARATLFSPAGTPIITFDSNGQQDIVLPETGTYIIQVQAESLFHTGSYSIGLEGLLPTNPVDE